MSLCLNYTAHVAGLTPIHTLANLLRIVGSIRSARVSSAQARGAAKGYAYWGAVRYVIRLDRNGHPVNVARERASSDRRSYRLAERDCAEMCDRESRIECYRIGKLSWADADAILRQLDIPAMIAAHAAKHAA